MSKYQDLNTLDELKAKGSISEEEYQQEKDKILNGNSNNVSNLFGMTENGYTMLMHLSQFAGFIVPCFGFAAPIILWLINRDNATVDLHGKNIANFIISMLIYSVISGLLCLILVGFVLLGILAVLEIIFVIIAAIKASKGQYWKYPLTITFFS